MKINKRKHTISATKGKHTKKIHPGYQDSSPIKLLTPQTLLVGIFIFALFIRLLYLKQMISTPLFHGLVVDAEQFDTLALKLLKGDFTHQQFIYMNPLYPFFLSLIYLICGHSHFSVVLTQAVIDSLSCLLLYYIASRCLNKTVGIIAATAYASYGLTIFYTGTLLAPTLAIFLTLSFIGTLLAAQEKRKGIIFCIAGILFGLVALARPNVVVLLLFLPLWFLIVLKKKLGINKSVQGFLLLLLGSSTVISLMAIRNYSIEKSFFPFSVHGGISFYIGNNPEATGTFMFPHGISNLPIDVVNTSILYAEKESGQSLTPSQASRYWFLRGLKFIKDNPLTAFSLYLKKCAFFWRKEELTSNVDYSLSKTLVPIFRFPFISFGIIAPFALLGIILSLTRKNPMPLVILFIFSHMFSVTIFFVTERYRVLVVPFLIICASYAVYCVVDMIRAQETRSIVISGAALALLFTGINKDFSLFTFEDKASHYSNLGKSYHQQGKLDEAFFTYKQALSIDPHRLEAHYNLGNVCLEKGLLDEAIEAYKKALEINNGYAEAHNNLGIAYGKKGQLDKAIFQFDRALTANPHSANAYYNRGAAHSNKGLLDEAISDFEKAIALNPEHAGAQFNLGMAYNRKGMQDEAISQFKKAITINPKLAEVYYKLGLGTLVSGDQ